MQPLNELQVRQIIKEEFDKNYQSGNTRIPPHRHNDIDNLKINASDIIGLTSGSPAGENTQIQFNDNGAFGASPDLVFDSDTSTLGVHNIKSSIDIANPFDLDIQATFGSTISIHTSNDNGVDPVFESAGISIFSDDSSTDYSTGNLNFTTGDAGFDPGTGVGAGVSGNIVITTGTSNTEIGSITIVTGDADGNPSPNDAIGGDIDIQTGSAFGNAGSINITAGFSTNGSSGSINLSTFADDGGPGGDIVSIAPGIQLIRAGVSGVSISTTSNAGSGNPSGPITISTGDADSDLPSGALNILTGSATGTTGTTGSINITAGSGPSNAGDINITSGDSTSGTYGRIKLLSGFGTEIALSSGGGHDSNLFIYNTTAVSTDGAGVITIEDAFTDPVSTPTGGGILYVSSGALHYLGSAGTDTVIAPA